MFNEKETKYISKTQQHVKKMSDRLEKIYFNNLIDGWDGSPIDYDFGAKMEDLLDVYHALRDVAEKLNNVAGTGVEPATFSL